MLTNIQDFLNENKSNKVNQEIINFLKNKEFKNKASKRFLYHGTNVKPNDFILDGDYYETSDYDEYLPYDHLFLSNNILESSSYGKYIIPCELDKYDHITFDVDGNNPSRAFDMDYGIDTYAPDEYHNYWQKYEESGKHCLIIKGYKGKSTIITPIWNVNPRIDLANEFYGF